MRGRRKRLWILKSSLYFIFFLRQSHRMLRDRTFTLLEVPWHSVNTSPPPLLIITTPPTMYLLNAYHEPRNTLSSLHVLSQLIITRACCRNLDTDWSDNFPRIMKPARIKESAWLLEAYFCSHSGMKSTIHRFLSLVKRRLGVNVLNLGQGIRFRRSQSSLKW